MPIPLHVLILEDKPANAELLLHELHSAGFEPESQTVATEPDYLAHLDPNLDLILADFSLPQFDDGFRALELLQTRSLDIPFILISSTIGEELAVTAIQRGAADYLMKDRLTRLGPAVARALDQKRLRDEKRRVQESLEVSETRYRMLFETARDGVLLLDAKTGKIFDVNPFLTEMLGYSHADFLGKNLWEIGAFKDTEASKTAFRELQQKGYIRYEDLPLETRDGRRIQVEFVSNVYYADHKQIIQCNVREMSKRAEQALRDSERRFRSVVEFSGDGIVLVDEEGAVVEWNRSEEVITGLKRKDIVGRPIWDVMFQALPEEHKFAASLEQLQAKTRDALASGQAKWMNKLFEWQVRRPDGTSRSVQLRIFPIQTNKGAMVGTIMRDITERKRAEQEISRRAEEFAALYETAHDLARAQELPALLQIIVERAVGLVHAASGSIFLFDPAHQDLEIGIAHGAELPVGTRFQLGEGLAGRVAQTHEPLVVDDYRTWEHRSPQMGNIPLTSCVAIPMLYSGELIGVLVVNEVGDTPRRFTEEDVRLLSLFAGLAAGAVYFTRLFAETQRRAKEFAALNETARDLAAGQELPALLQTIVERAGALVGAPTAALHLYDPEKDVLELVAERGLPSVLGTCAKLGEGLAGRAAQNRQAIIVDDYQTWDHRSPKYAHIPFRAMLELPMLYQQELIGVLAVHEVGDGMRKFTDADSRLLSLFAAQAAAAVSNTRLLAEKTTRTQQLELLYDAGLALNSVLKPQAQLAFLFEVAMKALHADRAEFFRADALQDALIFELGVGHSDETLKRLRAFTFSLQESRSCNGWVCQNRKPLYVPDVLADPRYVNIDPEIRSGLWLPVERDHELRGVLSILSTHLNAFTPQDEHLLMLFGNQAAVALENGRLFEATESQVRHLAALHTIDLAISASLDLNLNLELILEQVVHELAIDAADVLLFKQRSQTLDFVAGRGFRTESLKYTRLRLGEGLAGRAALERQIITIPDLRVDSDVLARSKKLPGEQFVAYYAAPLLAKGHVKGVLEIFHRAPLDPNPQWLDYLQTLATQLAIAIDSAELFADLQRSNVELALAYDTTLEGWSRALDLRDGETEGHTRRVTETVVGLASALGLDDAELIQIRRGVLLHDIGKMGIPDSVLLKPGPLTPEEWEIMRRHPVYAFELLSPIRYLRPALDVPYCHHEKWDGTGYPRGLKGEQIPLNARIFAVVDVWDALCSNRPYRQAWSAEKTLDYIRGESGKHFDPRVVEVFLDLVR